MEYYISHSFVRKVSLVVQAIDDFTGKPIRGSNVRVYIDGGPQAIKKNDGYHVFVNLDRPTVTVHAVGGQYNPQSIRCELAPDEDKYTFVKLRMLPNRSYPIPPDTTCIEGKAAPGSMIRIFCHDGAYKLLYDYKKEKGSDNRSIFIFHPDEVDMEGKLLHITDSEGKNRELLRIASVIDKDNRQYLLEKELSASYKKIGTSLFTVYETVADQKGSFFMPIANTFKEKSLYTCEAIGDKPVTMEVELESGKINRIDLR